ncbi:MAG: PEP-CTERM sorting domain-containing protein [Planctomycetota bacterium]|nr:PEP-CTERM sorting domain-containing protein [Planctomycetota bacterium]
MSIRFQRTAWTVVALFTLQTGAFAEILLQEDFTLRDVGTNVVGTAPNIDGGPNPNPNYSGGNSYESVYYAHDITSSSIVDETFFNNQFPPTGNALKITSDGGSNRNIVIPYQRALQADDVIRLTVRVNSAADDTKWNNFSMGFTSSSDPVVNGMTTVFVFQDSRIQLLNTAQEVAFPGAGYEEGQYDSYGIWHEVAIQYSHAKAGTAENAYQVFVDGQEFVMPIGGGNAARTSFTGVAFGNYFSGGANTRYISDWKLELNPIAGDLDGDGFVGQSDLNLILGNWGQDVPPADPLADYDGSGSIGQGDLNAVLSAWGQGNPPVAAVPEPASIVLMGLAGIGLVGYQFRKRIVAV